MYRFGSILPAGLTLRFGARRESRSELIGAWSLLMLSVLLCGKLAST